MRFSLNIRHILTDRRLQETKNGFMITQMDFYPVRFRLFLKSQIVQERIMP